MENIIKVGFIVNPIAGMGGRVGLKGSDGEAYKQALARGAEPVSPKRALEFFECLDKDLDLVFYTPPPPMGYDVLEKTPYASRTIKLETFLHTPVTTRNDTLNVAKIMLGKVDIIVFVGGDGTARDIYEAIGLSLPVIGVPSGVKMYSSIFAVNPCSAAELLKAFVEGEAILVEREVLDIDEEAFRRDELVVRLYGYLKTPYKAGYLQGGKTISADYEEEENKLAIARFVVEHMEIDRPYILGPGSTVKTICRVLGLNCTLLGVDVIVNGELVLRDAWEKELIKIILERGKPMIIVSPIGGQGFIFGRGNQQLSPRVLSYVDKEDVLVVATENKARSLNYLLVDTGDKSIDEKLRGYYKVLVNYGRYVVMKAI